MLVAVRVVHGLEVVQVQHHDGRPVAIALGAFQLVLAALQQRPAVQGLGQRVVGGQVFQLGAQAVGGHQHRADRQHQHREHVGTHIEGLEHRGFHQSAARVTSQDGAKPHGEHEHVQRQHHFHQPHRKVAAPVAQHEAQLHGIQHAHQQGEKPHARGVVGGPVREVDEHHGAARHHPVPGAPGGGLAHELPRTHVVGDVAQHQQLVGQHQAQPVGNGTAHAKQQGGAEPDQGRRRPATHAPDAGRVVPPHEQQHHGHDGGHEAPRAIMERGSRFVIQWCGLGGYKA